MSTTRTLQRSGLLSFMTKSRDGKYEVSVPTDEQLAAVLPWLIDQAVTWSRSNGYCGYVNEALPGILGKLQGSRKITRFLAADGLDCQGLDKDGFNAEGYDVHGYGRDGYSRQGFDRNMRDREGYDRRGYDCDGFDRQGLNQHRQTREQAVDALVKSWSTDHAAVMAKLLAEREAAQPAA